MTPQPLTSLAPYQPLPQSPKWKAGIMHPRRSTTIFALILPVLAFGLVLFFPLLHDACQAYIRFPQGATGYRAAQGVNAVENPTSLKIFVYPLPDWLVKDVVEKEYTVDWIQEGSEYDADIWVYKMIVASPFRTFNPEEATLFYIPFLPTRFLHLSLDHMKWDAAVKNSTATLLSTIDLISSEWPYYNRANGRDHFTTLTADAGRCVHLLDTEPHRFRDLFFLQHHGDLNHYEQWNSSWPCYKPDRDILLPSYITTQDAPIIPSSSTPREARVLYRYNVNSTTSLKSYHHTPVRQELWRLHQANPVEGADFTASDVAQTIKDMSSSIFCITPPGIVAHTGRFYRAIRSGCIPISFYRSYDLPFQSLLDYSKFTLNIQPSSLSDLNYYVHSFFSSPSKVKAHQRALDAVQESFVWDMEETPVGVHRLLLHQLGEKSKEMIDYRAFLSM